MTKQNDREDEKLQPRMVTVRMTEDQHTRIVKAAAWMGVSINTYMLNKAGLESPFQAQDQRPRGRKSEKLTAV